MSFPLGFGMNQNMLNINSSLDLGTRANEDQDKNPENIFENIEKKNKEIKDLFDMNVFEEENEECNLAEWLEENGFYKLLDKMDKKELDQKQIINMSDEKILELVEESNKIKFGELRSFLMKLDECCDADDLLNSIDKTIGN